MPTRPTVHRARRLRQEATGSETAAWQTLRQLRQYGFPVRRQHPIGPYIADFAIPKARLVIEVDGNVHGLEGVRAKDGERQAEIEAMGWRVMRFTTDEALDADWLWGRITDALEL